jgi:hypothetical protein
MEIHQRPLSAVNLRAVQTAVRRQSARNGTGRLTHPDDERRSLGEARSSLGDQQVTTTLAAVLSTTDMSPNTMNC